mgnify:CR=1 FL=1
MDFILLLKKIILGIIQGITEILPISSSGHLLIFSKLLNIDSNGLSLIIFLHFGSLVAMIIYYRKTIWNIITSLFKYIFQKNRDEECKYYCKLFLLMVVASIPAGIIGLCLGDIIDSYFTSLYYVFAFLIITGILLLINQKLTEKKSLKDISYIDALEIGLFQSIGVLPGISRSGITIFGGKVAKLNNEEAANFSFLLFLPVTLGSFIWKIISEYQFIFSQPTEILIGDFIAVIIAGFTTFIAVKVLFKVIKKGKLHYFSYYCFLVALLGVIICLISSY